MRLAHSQALVDEGAAVFAHEERAWVRAGQHRVAREHVPAWLELSLTPDARVLVFVDPNQRTSGGPGAADGRHAESLPRDWTRRRLGARLDNLRNPGCVRDLALPQYANPETEVTMHGLRDERVRGFIELKDLRHDELKVGLFRGENDRLASRWGKVCTEWDEHKAQRVAAELAYKAVREVAGVVVTHAAQFLRGNSSAETLARHLAVLMPARVASGRSDAASFRQKLVLRLQTLAEDDAKESDAAHALVVAIQAPTQDGLFIGAVEEFGGLERSVVVVTGFSSPEYMRQRFKQLRHASVRILTYFFLCVCVCVCLHNGMASLFPFLPF